MSSAPSPATRLGSRIVGAAGLLGLAYISLLDRGSSRMFAEPGIWFYWSALISPGILLLVRLWTGAPSIRLPASPWLWLFGASWVVLLSAALASPYRSQCLPWTAPLLAGMAVFVWLHDWIQSAPENPIRLARYHAMGAGLLMLASTYYWLLDISQLTAAQFFSVTLFEIRNPHPLGHSNYTAGLALLCLPVLAQQVRHSNHRYRWLALFAVTLSVFVLFTSGSRGGLLGLAALGITMVVGSSRPRRQIVWLLAGIVAVAGIMAVANPRIRAFFAPADRQATPNISQVQREAMITAGLLMGQDRPVLGWGLGTTPLVYPRYRAQLNGGAENVLQLHNTPVELWAGLGVSGLLLLGGGGWLVTRNRARAPVATATLAGYAVFSLTDYQLDVPIIVIGLAVLFAQAAAPAPAAANRRTSIFLSATILLTTLILFSFSARDRSPQLNSNALSLARDTTQSPRAIALLRESLAVNPDQEIAHFNLGWLLIVSNPVLAESHFLAAAHLVPDKGGVYFGLGLARLNQGKSDEAARAFALECLNEPLFLASPWWREPALANLSAATVTYYAQDCEIVQNSPLAAGWPARQATLLATLAPQLGQVSTGPEKTYRRERTGYPVLMRNYEFPPPIDLYDVREDPRFPASVSFTLPPKGWLPAPLLIKRLDDQPAVSHQ